MDKLLTPKEVSERIGICMTNTYKLIKLKGFPKIRIGKRIFIPEDALEKYLEENKNAQIFIN